MENITTYKSILNEIIRLEKAEEDFRDSRFKWLLIFFCISTLILIVYIICKWNSGLKISKELVGVALSPVFSYLLRSYEQDYLSQQRAYLLQLIHDTFSPADHNIYPFEDGELDLKEIKGIIHDALKSKL